MPVSIAILEPPQEDFGDLRRAFRAEAAADWDVHLLSSQAELFRLIADRERDHLVIVPEVLGDGVRADATLIPRIRALDANAPLVVTAASGDVAEAAQAVRAGATDFLVRGAHLRERVATLVGKLRGLLEVIARNRLLDQHNAVLRDSIQARFKIVGDSPQMRRLIDQVRSIADVPRPLLIVGERGTGKEQIAKAIHFSSGRAERPMITVNCAALSDTLLETELFGHEKGAFTGADTLARGKFELADGGTLFLDEIGHMSLAFQRKILRVVEYGTFTRVGATAGLRTSARIMAATNSDLSEKIEAGDFLPDLYDRLSFEVIQVPPLREREGDIAVLAGHFLEEFAREIPAFRGKTLSAIAIAELLAYRFPGNVRELKNIIERAAYRDTTNEITPEDIGLLPPETATRRDGTFHEQIEAYGQELIRDAMRQAEGNQAAAARLLGLTYDQFRYHHKKLG